MLLQHSAYYLLARGLPGLVNVAALALFTRLLSPDEFGRYALVVAGVGLANVGVFQWLRLVVGRFLQASQDDPEGFLAGILSLFLTLACAATGLGLLLGLLWPDPVWQRLLLLAVPLLIAQAWFELNLSRVQAEVNPGRYGKLLGSKSVLSLAVGGTLAWIGLGASAPMLGLLVAHIATFILFASASWRGISPRWPRADLLRAQLHYGLPLTVTFALAWVVSSSDRLLLGWLMDERAVGVYAAGYDLPFQGITLMLTIINIAAYPLAVVALEKGDVSRAREQLSQNGELVVSAALTGAVGLVVLGPHIVTLLIGEGFRAEALRILPWVTAASALAGIKAYHFDIAFHLGRDSRWLVVTGGIAAVMNVVLNIVLIPAFGIVGAAWATLAAFSAAALASAGFGPRAFAMPPVLPMVAKACVIASFAGSLAWAGAGLSGATWIALGLGLFFGAGGALAGSLAVNLCGLQKAAVCQYRKWRGLPGRLG